MNAAERFVKPSAASKRHHNFQMTALRHQPEQNQRTTPAATLVSEIADWQYQSFQLSDYGTTIPFGTTRKGDAFRPLNRTAPGEFPSQLSAEMRNEKST